MFPRVGEGVLPLRPAVKEVYLPSEEVTKVKLNLGRKFPQDQVERGLNQIFFQQILPRVKELGARIIHRFQDQYRKMEKVAHSQVCREAEWVEEANPASSLPYMLVAEVVLQEIEESPVLKFQAIQVFHMKLPQLLQVPGE